MKPLTEDNCEGAGALLRRPFFDLIIANVGEGKMDYILCCVAFGAHLVNPRFGPGRSSKFHVQDQEVFHGYVIATH